MAKIRVDWYKATGKWYSGGLVEVYDHFIWCPEFKQAIVDNQNELVPEWVDDEFFVICQTTESQDTDPEFKYFCNILFHPGAFSGMRKSKLKEN